MPFKQERWGSCISILSDTDLWNLQSHTVGFTRHPCCGCWIGFLCLSTDLDVMNVATELCFTTSLSNECKYLGHLMGLFGFLLRPLMYLVLSVTRLCSLCCYRVSYTVVVFFAILLVSYSKDNEATTVTSSNVILFFCFPWLRVSSCASVLIGMCALTSPGSDKGRGTNTADRKSVV